MLSMTGFGGARREHDGARIEVEAKAVNNRFLKLQLRLDRALAPHEAELETLIKGRLERGTVSVVVRLESAQVQATLRIAEDEVRSLHAHAISLARELGLAAPTDIGDYLRVPGVVVSDGTTGELDPRLVDAVRATLDEALDAMIAMRRVEGDRLAADLREILARIRADLERVKARAPAVVDDHRARMKRRIEQALESMAAGTLDEDDLAREVALFADRSDVSEEIQRLASHLDQFDGLLDGERVGRRLDFLLQEMLRETNTIASKASDMEIAQATVAVKADLERLREQAQNVE